MKAIKKFCNSFCLLKLENNLWCTLGAGLFSIAGLILGIMVGAYLGASMGGWSGELFEKFFPLGLQKKYYTQLLESPVQ